LAGTLWNGLRTRIGVGGIAIALLILAALAFILVNVADDRDKALVDTSAGSDFPCTVVSVYDGDGPINCSETDSEGKPVAVRLRGIDAREIDDSCQVQVCPKASGAEARALLTKLAVGRMQCHSFGPSYNRVDASCTNPEGTDISCELVRQGTAVRWPEYDPDGRLLPCVPKNR
jgi:endonuclease YncB( thermonuclease family)